MLWRAALALAGLAGAGGVILFAASAHGADADRLALSNAAIMLLVHAPAVIALQAAGGGAGWRWPAIACLMAAGVILFAVAVALPKFTAFALFPMAAPLGGTICIAAWLLVAVLAVASER